MNKRYLINQVVLISAIAFVGLGCGGDQTTSDSTEVKVEEKSTSNENQILEIDGKIFNIPSPIQTAILLKETGANYSKDMLNTPSKVTTYSTNFKKALNMGIYGADLAYVTLYDQTNDAISFLTAVKSLGDDLGISNTFNAALLERFEQNIGNQDSILSLVADAYKSSDRYLKNNQQNDIGGLILAGGWIESLHFATNAAKMSSNEDIINRIAEQKTTVENLIRLLHPYYKKAEFTSLIDDLKELNEIFSKVEYTYIYEKPSTDIENKTTTINSKVKIDITEEQIDLISQKILKLRVDIIS